MEPKIQSSFIPKRPISSREVPKRDGKAMSLVFFLSLIVFLVASGISGALFGYSIFLEKSIESKGASLESARAAFAPAQIQTLQRLDRRLSVAKTLLDNHLSTTRLFSLLERTTLKSIRFDSFLYTLLPDGQVSLRMAGAATSFASIALQSDIFRKEQAIQSPIFSSLNLDQQGNAVFTFESLVDPKELSYSSSIQGLLEEASTIQVEESLTEPESFADVDTEEAVDAQVEPDTGTPAQ